MIIEFLREPCRLQHQACDRSNRVPVEFTPQAGAIHLAIAHLLMDDEVLRELARGAGS
jgi:hypothetical protein